LTSLASTHPLVHLLKCQYTRSTLTNTAFVSSDSATKSQVAAEEFRSKETERRRNGQGLAVPRFEREFEVEQDGGGGCCEWKDDGNEEGMCNGNDRGTSAARLWRMVLLPTSNPTAAKAKSLTTFTPSQTPFIRLAFTSDQQAQLLHFAEVDVIKHVIPNSLIAALFTVFSPPPTLPFFSSFLENSLLSLYPGTYLVYVLAVGAVTVLMWMICTGLPTIRIHHAFELGQAQRREERVIFNVTLHAIA
jgi:hypothetical protein